MGDDAAVKRDGDRLSGVLALADKPVDQLTFGDRLNLLWTAVRPTSDEDPQAWRLAEIAQRKGVLDQVDAQGRPEYTNTWVAQQLDSRYGVGVTPSYLGKLRHADKPNPGLPVLQALTRFFKVDPAFLLPVTSDADRDMIAGVRDDLLGWLANSAPPAKTANDSVISIELRLTGATSPEEAQRQVAVALAQWLGNQGTGQP